MVLFNQQAVIGQQIETLIANFKKDSVDRKTEDYYKQRIQRLKDLWAEFDENHEAIEDQARTRDHEYFINNYYGEIHTLVERYQLQFDEEWAKLVPPGAVSKQTKHHKQTADKSEAGRNKAETIDQNAPVNEVSRNLVRQFQAVRRALIRNMEEIQAQVREDQNTTFYELKAQILERYMNDFRNTSEKLMQLDEAADWSPDEYYETSSAVQDVLIYLKDNIDVRRAESDINQQFPRQTPAAKPSVQLPRVTIPQFDGDYTKWQQFSDMFGQLINKADLPKVQKMFYLKNNLRGEAERVIRHLALTEDNYDAAWELLKSRYENKRVLTAAIINKLINYSPCTSSASSIKGLHDIIHEALVSLNNIGIDTMSWDPLLLQLMTRKLTKDTLTDYERSLAKPKELQTVKAFLEFLEQQFQMLESLASKIKPTIMKTCHVASANNATRPQCEFCKGDAHQLYGCQKFLNANVTERRTFIRNLRRCYNCLKPGHAANTCQSRSCQKCNLKHNTLLHINQGRGATTNNATANNTRTVNAATAASDNDDHQVIMTAANPHTRQKYVFLSTALVKLVANNGREIVCRAMLDSGSQINLISERATKQLGIAPQATQISIFGVGGSTRQSHQRINVAVRSIHHGFDSRLEAFVIQKIVTEQPSQYIDISAWPMPDNINLADPRFNTPQAIDVLLGAEFYPHLLLPNQIRLAAHLPILQNTKLGWIVTGQITGAEHCKALCGASSSNKLICGMMTEEETLDTLLNRFWEIDESTSNLRPLSQQESLCEAHFAQHTHRTRDGRFIVRLPLFDAPSVLGNSQEIAQRRFFALERRLAKNEDLKQQYTQIIREYQSLGHMEEIAFDGIPSPNYFIPHHCVLKPESSTTKLRVVFDASCKTSTGIALNEIMYSGPVVQSELFSILLRFRLPRFVFTADIEKMYRQIMVHSEDRKMQLIIWRDNPQEHLKYFQLKTVTFGTRAAPYLATKCLQRLAEDNSTTSPAGAAALNSEFYVDDVLTGSDSLSQALLVQGQLRAILNSAGFNLRKWCANHPQLLQGIPDHDQEVNWEVSPETYRTAKTLGMIWTPQLDTFCIKTNVSPPELVTKRTIASNIARIFDPLGLVAPVVVKAKIFIQRVWELKVTWDEALPMQYQNEWSRFCSELQTLNNMKISRHIFKHQTPHTIQLHCFTDASETAYGASIYIRARMKDGITRVNLLCSKSRVAPLKRQTIPRLELCAAVLGAELVCRVKQDLKYEDKATYFWTDSQIVLAWINASSSQYQLFVANRIAKIQALSLPGQWRHVNSKDNPADLVSRGMSPKNVSKCELWFYGPLFLHGSEESWPRNVSRELMIATDEERKKTAVAATAALSQPGETIYLIKHKNNIGRLQRIIGYILRFANTEKQNKGITLTPRELDKALMVIIRNIQRADFSNEIGAMQKQRPISTSSSLSTLSPFLDENGIIRVGGRLDASNLPYDAKHPMLLPYNDPVTKMIMQRSHIQNMHCGAQALLGQVRQRFWPIKGKLMARSIVQHCVRCTRARPALFKQIMGNLPPTRVQSARPFLNTGVDFCGPLWIHFKVRGKRPQKAYLAIFCCFATKAVHLEVVSDLTTDAFIAALKRFIARRGHCQNLFCDNATNFVGAKNQLAELDSTIHDGAAQQKISELCTTKSITFNFIPPRAPHFGGLWEAAVKSTKHLLLRSVETSSLTYEELHTVVVEIEAILNSRPLTPLSDDPNDLAALTPGHFLIGEPLTALPDTHSKTSNTSLLNRWKLVTQIKEEFWKRWSREYLSQLQQRVKWKEQSPNINEMTLVILQEDNIPPLKWPLGRIIKVYKGNDGMVSVVDIKTQRGELKRPIHRIAPLLREENDDTPEKEVQKRNAEPATVTHQSKQPRRSSLSSLVTLLCVMSLWSPGDCSVIELNPFTNSPGIYFEDKGTLELQTAEWKIGIYCELSPFWAELKTFSNGIIALEHMCKQMSQNTSCFALTGYFGTIRQELLQGEEILSPRTKRAALNIIGNVARTLFGVLDSDYAEGMEQHINNLKANDEYLLHLVQNQTSIIDSTLNIIKRDEEAVQHQLGYLQTHINNIMADLTVEMEHTHQLEAFTIISTQLILMAANLRRIQSAIMDVFTDSHHGRISPILLSPQQLKIEMNNIKGHLPVGRTLPLQGTNILELYKIMTVQGTIANGKIMFMIQLPLVDQQQFQLHKATPIPFVVNDTLMSIKSETTFQMLACVLQLFNNKPARDCEVSVMRLTTYLIELDAPNHWIFATTKEIELSAVCQNKMNQILIHGSGLLTLSPFCVIKGDTFTIYGHDLAVSVVQRSFARFYNTSMIQPQFTQKKVPVNNSEFSTEMQLKQLNELHTWLRSQNVQLPEAMDSRTTHHTIVSYAALILVLTVVVFIGLRIKCKKRPEPQTTMPQPLPRQRSVFNVNEV